MSDAELSPLLRSLLAALEANPDDTGLRLHVAEVLLAEDHAGLAARQCADVLAVDPAHAEALRLLARATDHLRGGRLEADFDWRARERELRDAELVALAAPGPDEAKPAAEAEQAGETGSERHADVIESDVRLGDVGGMAEVKRRLEMSVLTPMRHPELQARFGRSLHGGLLLYGPPGCGKTFLARAVAGELGARFYAVSLADVLDMWLGASERNLREVFEVARAHAPCVLFLDEIDAIGQKRSHLRANPAMRGTVNQLLAEMDSVRADNTGVFVLGATNHPWDVDPALLRPGRLDRMLLVSPPDEAARRAILTYHLEGRPVDQRVDVARLAGSTPWFSGADLAHLCDSAVELAFEDSVRSGVVRDVTPKDFRAALKEVRATTRGWFKDARSVVTFANADGRYDDLVAYLAQHRIR